MIAASIDPPIAPFRYACVRRGCIRAWSLYVISKSDNHRADVTKRARPCRLRGCLLDLAGRVPWIVDTQSDDQAYQYQS